jgi:carbamoyltransferase
VSEKLLDGNVVGWFQGHCEFGARALGNRSILANPLLDGMKDRINRVIKKREGFRPFAPMVIKEKQKQYFDVKDDIPYMNQVVNVKDEFKNVLKAVTHIDGTARVQTVYEHTKMHDLLKEFELKSGYPVLLNTSFNVKDKTMVLTPKDAVDTFFDTEMDILVINNYIIMKKNEKIN